jgi:hypothetical protein
VPAAHFCVVPGEIFQTKIAHRYGIPVASVRDALYDIIYDDALLQAITGFNKAQLLSTINVVHPSTAGHLLFAKVIA